MLFEIARFWASATCYDDHTDRFEIKGVMGPDEYHDGYPDIDQPGLNNNAYTNVMAAWCMAGCFIVPIEHRPGVCCAKRSTAMSRTCKVVPRAKVFISAPWPARWIPCCASSQASRPATTFSG